MKKWPLTFVGPCGRVVSSNPYLLYPTKLAETQIEERLGVEALADLDRGDVRFKPKKYELDMKDHESHMQKHL